MLRSVTLSFALCVLAAACALVEPPVPPGSRVLQVPVRNLSDAPVGELGVKVRGATLYAAQPPSVPADSTTTVTFYVPSKGEWWIAVNGIGLVEGRQFEEFQPVRGNEPCLIVFDADLSARYTCKREGQS